MGMNNENFYVLHLSDLHIRNEGKSNTHYSTSLRKLILDIEKETINYNNIIIVISGDTIDQGDYAKHRLAAEQFFTDLHEKIKDRVNEIIVVPGNHDKHRDPINSLVSIAHIENGLNEDEETAQTEWNKQLESYTEFFDLQNRIREIFGKDKNIKSTYGVDVIEIAGYNICFLRVDSSWCSCSSNDYRKLRIGKRQLEQLNQEYSDKKNQYYDEKKPIDLTIAVTHFPLNWLNAMEEEMCNNYFLSDRFLDVDVLMCGHVHDFSVVNHFNHEHSLLTLVTGIGWQTEQPMENRNMHRYSIYTFNLAYNSCDITMRKTKANGAFDYDYSVYVGTTELKDNKLRYPLKVKESASFIKINTVQATETQGLYVNEAVLSSIPKVSSVINSFSNKVSSIFEQYKQNCLECFCEKYIDEYVDKDTYQINDPQCKELYNKVESYLFEDGDLTQDDMKYLVSDSTTDDFFAFLYDVCETTVKELKECFSNTVSLRAHFRWHKYNKNECDSYSMLCKYPNDERNQTMQDVKWGGIIQAAFNSKEPIVFSANKQYNSIHTSWDDFITIIPFFNGSTYEVRIKKGVNEPRPILSFGISIKGTISEADALVLYILAYLKFDVIIGRIIDEYIRLLNIDTGGILSSIRNKQEEQEEG